MTDPNSMESLPDSEELGLAAPGENTVRTDADPVPSESEPEEQVNPDFFDIVDLSDEERSNFESLLTFGKKTDIKSVLGHSVLVSTLTVDEELQIGLLVKPYLGSDAYTRAYKTAVVAASVREIDGQPLYQPLSDREDSNVIMRKKWEAIKRYYPVAVDNMFNAVEQLEIDLGSLLEKITKKM